MESSPHQRLPAGALLNQTEARGSVHLIRFTIHPERRPELLEAVCSWAPSTEVSVGSDWKLLVELEDGDWLEILFTKTGSGPEDAPSYLDLSEGILGDEDGVVVGCARVDLPKSTVTMYANARIADALQELTADMTVYHGVRLAQVLEAAYEQGVRDGHRQVFEELDRLKQLPELKYRNPGRPTKTVVKKRARNKG